MNVKKVSYSLFTFSFSFPDSDLQPKSWSDVGSNLHCANVSSIKRNAEGTEGLVEVMPHTGPCGEVGIERIFLFRINEKEDTKERANLNHYKVVLVSSLYCKLY